MQTATWVEPSQVFTTTGSATFQIGQFSASLTAALSKETTTTENAAALYRAGDRYVVSTSFSYDWKEAGQTTLTVAGAHANRNEVKLANVPVLVKEIMDTNADVLKVGVQHLVPVGRLTIGPMANFLVGNATATTPRPCSSFRKRSATAAAWWPAMP